MGNMYDIWHCKNITIVLPNLRLSQQRCRRKMHIHECTPRRSGAPPTARMDSPPRRGPFPNYFGQTCYYWWWWWWCWWWWSYSSIKFGDQTLHGRDLYYVLFKAAEHSVLIVFSIVPVGEISGLFLKHLLDCSCIGVHICFVLPCRYYSFICWKLLRSEFASFCPLHPARH